MAEDDPTRRAAALQALLADVSAYHNHKELMAYAAATLYISGASAVLFGSDVWDGLTGPRL